MNWFDFFIIALFLVIILLLVILLILFFISYIRSILFVYFLRNIEKKGYRLKFVEYLNFDIDEKEE